MKDIAEFMKDITDLTGESVTPESALYDAYRNGAHHEDEAPWASVAPHLTDEEIAMAITSTIHWLLASGTVMEDNEEKMSILLGLHSQCRLWLHHQITDISEFLLAIARTRDGIFQEIETNDVTAWGLEQIRVFSLAHAAICNRCNQSDYSLYQITEEYGRIIQDAFTRRTK